MIATIRPIDRIIVVGSTFGCTGTVGMLELLKIFRKRLNVFGDVEKAFVLLNPYFDCCPDITHPDVRYAFADNSTSFYEAYDMFRDIGKTTFRIMPMEPRVVWEYVEDGLLQTNPSTPSELLAAIAIHDFVKRPNHNRDTVDCILREGTRANIHELIVSSPVLGNTSDISGDLGYFSIFTYCIEKKGLLAGLDNRPAFRHAFRDVSHYERTTELIYRFVHLYEDWWTEISVVGGFRIFDFNADVLKKLIVGKYLPPYGFFGMLSDSYDTLCREFDRRFNRIYPHNQISLYGALLAAFRGATASLTDVPLRSI